MSQITDAIEEVQEDLDDAKNNIHKVKQRINELENFKLEGTTLDELEEDRLNELLNLDLEEDDLGIKLRANSMVCFYMFFLVEMC